MQLNLNHLPDHTIHVWWFGDDFGILELAVKLSVEQVLCHCQLIQLCKVTVTVEIFIFGLNQSAALYNTDLTGSQHMLSTPGVFRFRLSCIG
jgi:hypothetical protein